MGATLSPYLLQIARAPVGTVASIAVCIVTRTRVSIRNRFKNFLNDNPLKIIEFERELEAIRSEFRQSAENVQSTARNAARIGENVIAAVKPIELALRDLNGRIIALEGRTATTDPLFTNSRSSDGEQRDIADETDRAFAEIDVRLKRIQQQLTTVIDQHSTLEKMFEGVTAWKNESSEMIGSIDVRLAAVDGYIESLARRLDQEQKERADLSTLTKSLPQSIASPKTTPEQAAQCLRELERRFAFIAPKLAELEAWLNSVSAAVDRRLPVNRKDTSQIGSPGDTDNSGNDGEVDSGAPYPGHTGNAVASRSD